MNTAEDTAEDPPSITGEDIGHEIDAILKDYGHVPGVVAEAKVLMEETSALVDSTSAMVREMMDKLGITSPINTLEIPLEPEAAQAILDRIEGLRPKILSFEQAQNQKKKSIDGRA